MTHFVSSQFVGVRGPGVQVYWQEAERALAFLIAASWKYLGWDLRLRIK